MPRRLFKTSGANLLVSNAYGLMPEADSEAVVFRERLSLDAFHAVHPQRGIILPAAVRFKYKEANPILMRTIFLAFLTATPLAFAQTTVENDFAALKKIRTEALAKATEPIDRKFRDESEKLLAKAIQSGNLDTAEKIKNELLALDKSKSGSSFEGYWLMRNISGYLFVTKITPNALTETGFDWNGKRFSEDYKTSLIDGKLRYSDGSGKLVYETRGAQLIRSDGFVWDRIDESTYNRLSNAKTKEDFKGRLEQSTPLGRRNP